MIVYKQPNEEVNNRLIESCKTGDLELVKYLLTSPKLKIHADIHYKDDDAFTTACDGGHLHIIKYLCTSPELKEHVDIRSANDLGFVIACENNNLELVKYFLISSDLNSHADIHTYSNYALREICKRGHLELLEYLTSSIEVNAWYQKEDWPIGFFEACRLNQYHIARYFIFQLNFEINNKELKTLPLKVKNMFALRKLNMKLKKGLKEKINENCKIIKI